VESSCTQLPKQLPDGYYCRMQLLSEATNAKAEPGCPDWCATEILDALPGVIRFVRRHMRSRRAKGLSLPQFRTLALLRSVPSANLSAVAEFLGSSLPTASRIVSGLVSKGLVERCEHADDRRQLELVLTSRGSATVEIAHRATREELSRELQNLTAPQRAQIAKGMQSLRSLFVPDLHTDDAGRCCKRKQET
jgi:DNA-binding MarR family transcriptional regulator